MIIIIIIKKTKILLEIHHKGILGEQPLNERVFNADHGLEILDSLRLSDAPERQQMTSQNTLAHTSKVLELCSSYETGRQKKRFSKVRTFARLP